LENAPEFSNTDFKQLLTDVQASKVSGLFGILGSNIARLISAQKHNLERPKAISVSTGWLSPCTLVVNGYTYRDTKLTLDLPPTDHTSHINRSNA
jgi:hypothetical protein